MMKIDIHPAEMLFKKFSESYKKRDIETLLSLFTPKSNMWGTGVDEYRIGLKQIEEQLKRDWSQSESAEVVIKSFVPNQQGDAWAAALGEARITVAGKGHVFPDFRGTITVENQNGSWKILHMHASFPDYRNAEKNSFPET
jgi:hypothetical protein